MHHPLDARIGTVLRDRFRILRRIGHGGTSVVYAGEHRNGTPVAIKFLSEELARDPAHVERFIREGKAANSVHHAGIVQVYDDGQAEDGSYFLVLELLEGSTLKQLLDEHPTGLPAHDVSRYLDEVLQVLEVAHAQGVVHRDIKPDNLFLQRSGKLKLLDFGIAYIANDAGDKERTHASTMLGTPAYMPPEQARSLWDEVDAQSDLWSLAATAVTLLTGQLPRQARTLNEMLLQAMTVPIVPIHTIKPDVPPVLASVIDRALQLDKSNRYANAAEMRAALSASTPLAPPRSGKFTLALFAAATTAAVTAVVLAQHRATNVPVVAPPSMTISAAPQVDASPMPLDAASSNASASPSTQAAAVVRRSVPTRIPASAPNASILPDAAVTEDDPLVRRR